MHAAEQIKQALDLRRVIEHYGGNKIKRNSMCCPFHNEDTPSFKIKNSKRWTCFGCGQGGSVIDYVMKLFGISTGQAILRLNHDFNLGITNGKPDLRQIEKQRRAAMEKAKYEKSMALVYEWHLLEYKKLYRQFHDNKPKKPFEELSEEFIEALKKLPRQEDWLMNWR